MESTRTPTPPDENHDTTQVVHDFSIVKHPGTSGEPDRWVATSTSEPWLSEAFPSLEAAEDWAFDTNDRLTFGDLPRQVVDKTSRISREAAQWYVEKLRDFDPLGRYRDGVSGRNLYATLYEVYTDEVRDEGLPPVPAADHFDDNPTMALALGFASTVSRELRGSELGDQLAFATYVQALSDLGLDGPLRASVDLLRVCGERQEAADRALLEVLRAWAEYEMADIEARPAEPPHPDDARAAADEAVSRATLFHTGVAEGMRDLGYSTRRTLAQALSLLGSPAQSKDDPSPVRTRTASAVTYREPLVR